VGRAIQVKWGWKDPVVHLGQMLFLAPGLLVARVVWVPLEALGQLALWDLVETPDQAEFQARLEELERLVRLDKLEYLVQWEDLVRLVLMVQRETLEVQAVLVSDILVLYYDIVVHYWTY